MDYGIGPKVASLPAWRVARMSFPSLNTLRAYWEALREGGGLPLRNAIDPRGIENALEHAFIAERLAPGVARFRVAGMFLNDLMGMEVRGMPLTAVVEPAARDRFAQTLEQVFACPAVAEITVCAAAGFSRPPLEGRMLLLPLRDDAGVVSCALGGLALQGEMGRTPRRLDAADTRLTPVAPPAAKPDPGFAEPAPSYTPRHPAKRPHLRLVRDD